MLKSLGAAGLLLVGGGTTAAVHSDGVAADDARFRVSHSPPDAPPVGVYVGSDPFPGLQGVSFGVLPDYFTVPAGTYQVEMMSAGDASTVIIDARVTFRHNRDYAVATMGVLDAITPVMLTGANRPAPYGKAGVRVVHFSSDTPEVDIVIKNGLTLFSRLAFGDTSQYEMVPTGTYDLQVVLSSNGAVVLDLPGTTLPSGRTISVLAIGFVTDESPGFSILPVVDAVLPTRKPRSPSGGDVCRMG